MLLLTAFPLLAQDVLILDDNKTNQPKSSDIQLPASPPEKEGDESYVVFYKKWAEFQQAYEERNAARVDSILKGLVSLKEKNQIPSVPEVAVSLVRYADRDLAAKRGDDATRLYKYSISLDPAFSDAYFGLARASLARGVTGLPLAVISSVRGFLAPLSTPEGEIYFYTKAALCVLAALIALGFVFGLLLLVKYGRLLGHDAVETFAHYDSSIVNLLVWVVLFLPVLVFMGPLWLAPFWMMALWGYAKSREKALALFFLIVFAASYPVYHGASNVLALSGQHSITPFVGAFSFGPSPKVIGDMDAYVKEHPQDVDASLLLAYLYKMDHKSDEATEVLQKHVLDHPGDSRAYNNLSAIYFLQGETDFALRLSEKAADLDGRNALYKYNLSSLNRAKFNFNEAEGLLQEARRLDPLLISSLESSAQEKVVDSVPAQTLVWQRIRNRDFTASQLLLNPFTIFGAALLFLTFVFHLRGKNSRSLASACIKCGKAFCKKCQPAAKGYGFCTQCLHMFVKKDGVSPASRKEKMMQIDSFAGRQNVLLRICSLVVPGSDNFYHNHMFSGALLSFVWLALLGILLVDWKFAGLSYLEARDNLSIMALPFFLALGVVYLGAVINAVRKWKS